MDKNQTLAALSSLAQETRLNTFRLLVQAGAMGMLAGEIGEALDVRQNTMSTNLAILRAAGLLKSQREGRAIRYYANMDGMRGLLAFLMQDCCGGQPEACRPVLETLTCPC